MRPPSTPRAITLDRANRRLWRGGEPFDLTARAFAILDYLAQRPGRVVTKEELLDAVWADTHVTDAVLSVYVAEIRRICEDDPRRSHVIETMHRRGYRLLAPLETIPAGDASAAPAMVPAAPGEGGPVSPLPLVGRQAQMDQLLSHCERAQSGKRQIVLLSGEAGIGKSALVDAFLSCLATHEPAPLVARGHFPAVTD